jgi:hypothetical protein
MCGSALPRAQMNAPSLVVPAGSLNSDVVMRPNAHIFMASKACWDNALENVPAIDRLPV